MTSREERRTSSSRGNTITRDETNNQTPRDGTSAVEQSFQHYQELLVSSGASPQAINDAARHLERRRRLRRRFHDVVGDPGAGTEGRGISIAEEDKRRGVSTIAEEEKEGRR
jgi:hypothetical protein